ncbi:unnamed protein product, partial [Hapterophycus canaliculatus]
MRALIRRGADVDEVNDDGGTTLATAARHNEVTAIDLLVEAGADVAENVRA